MNDEDLIDADYLALWSDAELIAFRPVKVFQVLHMHCHVPNYHERSSKARRRARVWARDDLSRQICGGHPVMRSIQSFRFGNNTFAATRFAAALQAEVDEWAAKRGLDVEKILSSYLAERRMRKRAKRWGVEPPRRRIESFTRVDAPRWAGARKLVDMIWQPSSVPAE